MRKDAVTLNFGPSPAGALQGWVFPNGMAVNLAYSGSQLAKITNNLGRSLSLSYSGNDVASVTDDTGRAVAFGYDVHHNLTSFTDPRGATTKSTYDTSGTYDTFGHLTQVFYPFRPQNPFVTNWYDPLGRVIQQANANASYLELLLRGLAHRAGRRARQPSRHVSDRPRQSDQGRVRAELKLRQCLQ